MRLFPDAASGDVDLALPVNSYLGVLGEAHPVVRLVKAALSQAIVAPVILYMKMMLFGGSPFKDVKLGWLVLVVFESQAVHVIHQKRERSNHDDEEPPRDPERFDFEFTWELKLSFDPDLSALAQVQFGISSFATTDALPSDAAKKLEKRVKPWRLESLFDPEKQTIEKACLASAPKAAPVAAPNTYMEFKKQMEAGSRSSSSLNALLPQALGADEPRGSLPVAASHAKAKKEEQKRAHRQSVRF